MTIFLRKEWLIHFRKSGEFHFFLWPLCRLPFRLFSVPILATIYPPEIRLPRIRLKFRDFFLINPKKKKKQFCFKENPDTYRVFWSRFALVVLVADILYNQSTNLIKVSYDYIVWLVIYQFDSKSQIHLNVGVFR